MTERASKPSESGAAASPRLETVEFEPGMLDELSPEDIERLKRGERLEPRRPPPAPAAGGVANAIAVTATDGTPIAPANHAAAYEGPRDLPSRTAHDTFEMQTVAVAVAVAPAAHSDSDPGSIAEDDARKAPTQRKLRSPVVEKDTIPDLTRREPTLRGLHAGAPGADDAPPSTGFTAVVVPPVEAPADDTTLIDPVVAPLQTSWGAGRVGLILAAAALAIVIALVALRSRAPEAATAAPAVTVSSGARPAAPSAATPPVAEVTALEPIAPAPPPPTTPALPAAKPKAKPLAPHAAPAPVPSGKAGPKPDPDDPML